MWNKSQWVRDDISLARASELAPRDMCVLRIASVALILAVSVLANAGICFGRSLVWCPFRRDRFTQSPGAAAESLSVIDSQKKTKKKTNNNKKTKMIL